MNTHILQINSSGRTDQSITRDISDQVIHELGELFQDITVQDRDLNSGMRFVNEAWIDANFTPAENRSAEQQAELQSSDALVEEIKQADVLVIGAPIYNFSIPAVLKAWVDQIARARLTFKYTEQGPVGLMTGKQAVLVMASGGVPIGSAMDFATPYLQHVLSFIGIHDVVVIDANQIKQDPKALKTQLQTLKLDSLAKVQAGA